MRGLHLRVEPGERVLLLGASGAGKSTLLHALAGVLGGEDEGEQAGDLLVDGQHPAEARGRAGLVLQDPDSQAILARVGDDVAFGCENLGLARDEIWRRVHEAVRDVGLGVSLDRSTSELSGGQKQRLALAGVLAMRPGLLLLDEPTANLDPEGVAEVRDAVSRVLESSGATLVVIEHRVDVWLPLVDRVVVLPGSTDDPASADGGLLADGEPDAVLAAAGRSLADAGVWVPGHPPELPHGGTSAGRPLLEAKALAVSRNARRRTRAKRKGAGGVPVRTDVSLGLAEGEALALTGANGSGKTTLALTCAGLIPPFDGEVMAEDALRQGAAPHPFEWRSRELLTRIGMVFQEPEHQLLAGTVRAELEVGPRALKLSSREIRERVDRLLERLRLDRLAEANPFTLSGGEKRRLSVATALATRPRVLVLDEPSFGQDRRTWQEQVALLAELLAEGSAIIAATHDRLFVEALADREVRL